MSYRAGGSSFSMDWTLSVSRKWFDQAIIINPGASSYQPSAGSQVLTGAAPTMVRGSIIIPVTP
jgi:hypothetical protein